MRLKIVLIIVLLTICIPLQAEEVDARVRWASAIVLTTPVSGKISSVRVAVGDKVKKGQLLATLDSRPFRAQVKHKEAAWKRLQNSFSEAQRELERAEELFERTVLSSTDLQQAKLSFDMTGAELREAEAALELAKLDLEYSRVTAPLAGLITARKAEPGEVVINRTQVSPILEMVDQLHLEASGITVADPLPPLGATVKLRFDGEELPGRISELDVRPGEESARISVIFKVEEPITHPGRAVIVLP